MDNEQEELLHELIAVEVMVAENPCRMPQPMFGFIKGAVRAMLSKDFMKGMSREQVRKYLGISMKTLERYVVKYEDFPKPRHDGHLAVTFATDEVVKWKLKHKELYKLSS